MQTWGNTFNPWTISFVGFLLSLPYFLVLSWDSPANKSLALDSLRAYSGETPKDRVARMTSKVLFTEAKDSRKMFKYKRPCFSWMLFSFIGIKQLPKLAGFAGLLMANLSKGKC